MLLRREAISGVWGKGDYALPAALVPFNEATPPIDETFACEFVLKFQHAEHRIMIREPDSGKLRRPWTHR